MAHVAVVGGGYAGMAAAVTLAAHSVPVTVFEAAKELGGRARRVEYKGVALDNGLHVLSGAYVETLRLIGLVNPNGKALLTRLPLEWHSHPEFHLKAPRLPAPLHLLGALLTAHGLSRADRVQALRFVLALRRRAYALPRDISVELLLEQRGQSEKVRRVLWRPLCVAALNTPPAVASAQVFVNVLRDTLGARREASDLLISRVDLSALFPQPAAAWIERRGGHILTGHRVTAIDTIGNGFVARANGSHHSFTHVICALPPHQVNAFLIGITELSDVAATISDLSYQPIHSVWLQYPHSVNLPAPMMGWSRGLVHWVFDRERLCGQRGLVGAVVSARGAHEDFRHDDFAVRVHQELQQHVGALPDPLWHRVIAEKRATFSCKVSVRRPPQITALANFYLAGDYAASDYPATIETAVRSGIVCAEHIISGLSPLQVQ